MVIFHSYVSLPEGIYIYMYISYIHRKWDFQAMCFPPPFHFFRRTCGEKMDFRPAARRRSRDPAIVGYLRLDGRTRAYNVGTPVDSWFITLTTMVYCTYNYLITAVYAPTYNSGGPHCRNM